MLGFDLFQRIVDVGSYKTLGELVQVFEIEKEKERKKEINIYMHYMIINK